MFGSNLFLLESKMKKFLFLLSACLFSASTAGAWGLIPEFVKIQPEQYKQNNGYRKFLLHDIYEGRPELRVCINPYDKATEDEMFENIQTAFSSIFAFVRQEIEQSGRSAEFADFLAVWPKNFKLHRMTYPAGKNCKAISGQFDLEIKGQKTRIPIDTGFSVTYGKQGHALPVQDPKTFSWSIMLSTDHPLKEARVEIAMHEVSHLFGLADQYSNFSADKTYSLRAFEELTKIESIMQGSSMDKRRNLTCDDAEGFINAMDFIMRQDGKTSNRLQHGWADLCGRNYIYMDGVPQRNADPAQAKQEHDSFVKWAANGYKAADKPAFASKALEVQRDLAARLAGATKNLSALKDRKTELDGLITSKKYEIQNAKFYKWTPRQVKAEQAKLKKLEAERDKVAQDIAQLENNIATGKFPELAKKDTPAVAVAGSENKGRTQTPSKSTPVISGNYVGPKGAQVVAATSKPQTSAPAAVPTAAKPAPVATPKPSSSAPVAAPVSQPVKVDNSPKAALDRYIAAHPGLRDSLLAVRTGTALPTQAREVQEYQALFDAYKNGDAPKTVVASAAVNTPAPAKAETKAAPKTGKKADNAAKRKELEDKYKAQCTLSSFEQKYEKELTPIRKRLNKGQKLNQRQASLWNAYSQRLKQVQSTPWCQNLSAQLKAL